MQRAVDGLQRSRSSSASVIGLAVSRSQRAAGRGRLDDHRAADDAVDRVVPAGAILLFKLSEAAILFVVVLGAAPSIANGLITASTTIPPILLRAGRVLGATRRRVATGTSSCRPRCPSFVAGLKQGWAFAWRSLMAGELLVIIANKPSIGSQAEVRAGVRRRAGTDRRG